jgi:hypothetical protein
VAISKPTSIALVHLRRTYSPRHREAGEDQDDRVDRAESGIEVTRCFGERCGIEESIDRIGGEDAAEEHQLG